jgi:hypothetical protein
VREGGLIPKISPGFGGGGVEVNALRCSSNDLGRADRRRGGVLSSATGENGFPLLLPSCNLFLL